MLTLCEGAKNGLTSDSSEQSDDSYKLTLTEPDDTSNSQKQVQLDKNLSILGPGLSNSVGFNNDVLDDGVNFSKIPKDFTKSSSTID